MEFKQKEYQVVQSLGSTIAETLQNIAQKGFGVQMLNTGLANQEGNGFY